jgi:tetratricopeptide (TPR) repeat protein
MWRTVPILAVLLTASRAHAQGPEAWLGKRVVIKYKQPLRFGPVAVEPKEYRAYTVAQVEGDQLLLTAGGVSGWVRTDDVVPLDQAVAFYTQEILKNPSSWNAYLYRGFVWDVKHEYDKAIADYSQAIQLYPLWANTFNNRGWTWHRKKAYDKAIADYSEAIRLDPKCVLAIANRGLAWQDKRDYYKALVDYNRAVKVDPSYARGYTARAWLYATCPDKKFRDGKLAVESATRACDLTGWKEADKLAVLAAAYAERGDFDKAVKWQEKAITLFLDLEDRKKGLERLSLYKDKKPCRLAEVAGPVEQPEAIGADLPAHERWAQFPDSERAGRVFAELEERIGMLPEGTNTHERRVRARRLDAIQEDVARKYHLKPREVEDIWRAGQATDPPDHP